MSTSLEHLLSVIDEVPDPAWCEGVVPPAAVEVGVDGSACAMSAPGFVTWLLDRSEDAPFGDRQATRLDPQIRATRRLRARGSATVRGLDVHAIEAQIEQALATGCRITATLADVLTYPVGGKFERHKDTPREAAQLGTLIVCLPIAHAGGALTLTDGREKRVIDWSKPADGLRWVAMFGDVDHAIAPVTSGARVTLVYTLTLSSERRARPAELAAVADAMISVIGDRTALLDGGHVLIPCSRLIVAPADAEQPLGLDVLRGVDRVLAETLAECGAQVAVRECLIATEDSGDRDAFPEQRYDGVRLARTVPASLLANQGMTFEHQADGEYLEDDDSWVSCLGAYVLDTIDEDAWLVRRAARAKVIYEGMFSSTGYFGNECGDAYVYSIAALEVALEPYARRVA